MKSIDPEAKHEIIIVRHDNNNNGEEEQPSGVWKIAYADFMTAMMAFFLVMWLINSVNEDTKAAIANYFNPIKLVDSWDKPRSIKKNQGHVKQENEASEENLRKTDNRPVKAEETEKETQLMDSPYQALNVIADAKADDKEHQEGLGGVSEGGLQQGSLEGVVYRDPFSPEYWKKNVPPEPVDKAVESRKAPVADLEPKAGEASEKTSAAEKTGLPEEKSSVSKSKQKEPATKEKYPDLLKDISSDVAVLMKNQAETERPLVRISLVENGIAIELTDSQNYGMFTIGSAKPDKRLVELLEGMAKILEKYKGKVVIGGYTDARPYKTLHYDNWQLSTARAQMAYYMLVRGGLDEKRVLRVEGYADRDLKNSKDSYAAENRRIAIFLRSLEAENR